MKNKIYFIEASQYYPVGSAGAVVIAKNAKRAAEMVGCLRNPSTPKYIGVSNLKEQVVFENSTDY